MNKKSLTLKKNLGDTVALRVLVPADLYNRILIEAARENRKVSAYLRLILSEHFPKEGGKENG